MVTKAADQVGQFVSMLDELEIRFRTLTQKQGDLQAERDRLNSLGWVDAKPHYRDGKYLYLIYPMQDGERKREYIGADPEKIAEALARIDRKAVIEEVERKLGAVTYQLSSIQQYIRQARTVAYSENW